VAKHKKSLKEKFAIRRSKTILGHSHVPAITKGVYAVGSSVRRLSAGYNVMYNKGPAKWLRSGAWITGDAFNGYTISRHEKEPENRRREAVMATRAKYGR